MIDSVRWIAGVMSGTSLDGVDVAFVRVDSVSGRGGIPGYRLVGFASVPYERTLRERILEASTGRLPMRELFILDADLGDVYARAISAAAEDTGFDLAELDAVGLHGQTVWHAPDNEPHGITVQIGSASIVADRLGTVVVNDFRSADVAAGGQGAPLVPYCDLMLLASPDANRVALNVGGIANLTWLPIGVTAETLVAFDTGPGNSLLDAAMRELRGEDFDAGGALAAQGSPNQSVLNDLLSHPWFRTPPPRSTGRERFGEDRGRGLAREMREAGMTDADILATLTMFTAATITDAIDRFAALDRPVHEVAISGGGAHNDTLIRMLGVALGGVPVRPSDEFGIPSDAKEAFCFAILAHATLNGLSNTVPSVTGARHSVIGGSVRFPGRPGQS